MLSTYFFLLFSYGSMAGSIRRGEFPDRRGDCHILHGNNLLASWNVGPD